MTEVLEKIRRMPVVALNLHMFDDPNINTSGSAGMSLELKTYYDKNLIVNATPKLRHDQFAQKRPIPKNGGKVIEFRRFGTLPVITTALVEGITPAGQSVKVSALTSEVQQYGAYLTISDVLDMTAIDNTQIEMSKLLSGQAGRSLDRITREVLMGGSNKIFQPSVSNGVETEVLLRSQISADTCQLTLDTLKVGSGMLKRMLAEPVDADYVCIVHPDVATDLMRDKTGWEEVHKYTTPENIYAGELGRYGGIRFVESTEAKIIGPGWLFGDENQDGVCRMTLKTALDGTGSTNIFPNETISAAQAAELNARITGGETVKMYVGGKEATIVSCTAGVGGTGKFVVSAAVTSVAANSVICGYGAGADGSAIYCTLLLGANAYGTTELEGGGLEYIAKQRGSGGTSDPLNQRSTLGWKATKTAERLVEEYMLRIESSSRTFGKKKAVSN